MAEFRTIEDLATQVGHCCWFEHELFALTGAWASQPVPEWAAISVFFHTASLRHGQLTTQWRSHLPVRAGVDPDAFVVPPVGAGPEVLDRLNGADHLSRLTGLVSVVLPRLLSSYSEDLAHSSPVSEAPVRSLMEVARFVGGREIDEGAALLQSALQVAEGSEKVLEFGQALERSLNDTFGIFPSAWAS